MKRNGKNMSMPKDGVMISDVWSRMTNTQRRDYSKINPKDKEALGIAVEQIKSTWIKK